MLFLFGNRVGALKQFPNDVIQILIKANGFCGNHCFCRYNVRFCPAIERKPNVVQFLEKVEKISQSRNLSGWFLVSLHNYLNTKSHYKNAQRQKDTSVLRYLLSGPQSNTYTKLSYYDWASRCNPHGFHRYGHGG